MSAAKKWSYRPKFTALVCEVCALHTLALNAAAYNLRHTGDPGIVMRARQAYHDAWRESLVMLDKKYGNRHVTLALNRLYIERSY
jgi:hypothetical protein